MILLAVLVALALLCTPWGWMVLILAFAAIFHAIAWIYDRLGWLGLAIGAVLLFDMPSSLAVLIIFAGAIASGDSIRRTGKPI